MRRAVCMAAFIGALAGGGILARQSLAAAASADPYCTGTYGGAPPRTGLPLRFGIDAGLAGSAGPVQPPSTPDDAAKDLAAVRTLDPTDRVMVVRLNRLFWSDGQSGIDAFKRQVALYTGAGLDVEIQVRYHPAQGQAGEISAWTAYVRHVVDTFGANRRVVDMTITNEVNVTFSPNTSDGYYAGAEQALIAGIEAAHDEALAKGFRQLQFGFTYAYRFSPSADADFFTYLGQHGGVRFVRALGFVGVDFYPGTIYPPVMAPTDTYRAELAQAAGVVRNCYLPKSGIGPAVPIWFTENGAPSPGPCPAPVLDVTACGASEDQQAAALTQLTQAACDYAGTFNITDYRWFNLRDSTSTGAQTLIGPTYSAFGLLRDDYSPKPAFAAYRDEVAACGAAASDRGRHQRRVSRRRHRSTRPRPPARSLSFTG